jgi:hypothetical protein
MLKKCFFLFILVFFVTSLVLQAQITAIYPKNNSTIQETTPTLKWNDFSAKKSPVYRVFIWKVINGFSKTKIMTSGSTSVSSFSLRYVYSNGTRERKISIPKGYLKKGYTYIWQVKPFSVLNQQGMPNSISINRFMFTIGNSGGMTKAPTPVTATVSSADIVFDFNKLGQDLSVKVGMLKFAKLPDGLITPRGSHTAFSIFGKLKYRFDLAKPIFFGTPGLVVKLSNGKTLKVDYDRNKLGTFKKLYDINFDIYHDTPGFDNYSGNNFLDKSGTCLGIVFTVKNFFESVDFGTNKGVNILKVKPMDVLKVILKKKRFCAPDSKNMRDFSLKHKDKLKKIMSFNHLDNLNPMALGPSLKSVFNLDDDRKTFRKFCNALSKGELPLLAMYQNKKVKRFKIPFIKRNITFKLSGAGHAMLVYRIYEFSKKSLMCIYDPNILYSPKRPYHTYITYTANKKHGAFAYHAEKGSFYDTNFASKYKSFFLMPSSKLLFSLSGILSDSWKKVNNFLNDIVTKVVNFINPIISKVTQKLSKIKIKWPF